MKHTTTDDVSVNQVRVLVHGDSGIGKTTSLRTLPKDKTLIAGSERGLLPLRGCGMKVVQIEKWDDVRTLIIGMRAGKIDDVDYSWVKCLAVDSLSDLSDLCMRHIVQVDRRKLILERTKDATDKPFGVYEEQMTLEDYQLYRTRMRAMTSAAVHLPMHVIFTSLSAWTEDKQTGGQFRSPALSGKFAHECPAFFDLVFHMEATKDDDGKDLRVWRTFNDGRIIAKDASGVLAPFEATKPPDGGWPVIFAKILKNGNNKNNKKKDGAK